MIWLVPFQIACRSALIIKLVEHDATIILINIIVGSALSSHNCPSEDFTVAIWIGLGPIFKYYQLVHQYDPTVESDLLSEVT